MRPANLHSRRSFNLYINVLKYVIFFIVLNIHPIFAANLTYAPTGTITDRGSTFTLTAEWAASNPPYQVQFFAPGSTAPFFTSNGETGTTLTSSPIPASDLGADGTTGTANYSVQIIASGSTIPDNGAVGVAYDFTSEIDNVSIVAPTDPVTDFGSNITLTAEWQNGVAPYTVQFFNGTTPLAAAATVNTSPHNQDFPANVLGDDNTDGTVNLRVDVTSAGITKSANADVTYNFTDELANITLSADPGGTITDNTETITLTAQWSGGTPPYQAQFSRDGVPFSAPTTNTTSVDTPVLANTLGAEGTAGTATFTVQVTSGGTTESGELAIAYDYTTGPSGI